MAKLLLMGKEMKFFANLHKPINIFWLFLLLLVVITVWAALFEIEKTVIAKGEIAPLGKVTSIQNSVPGRIDSINFDVGDKVTEGDEIVNFDVREQLNQYEEMQLKLVTLRAVEVRLTATLGGEKFLNVQEDINPLVYNLQQKIFNTEQLAYQSELEVITVEKENLVTKLNALKVQKKSMLKEMELA